MNFKKKGFHKSLLSDFIFLSLINLINCLVFKKKLVILSENQILYIYSSLAQVIGALLGLTIAGYGIIDPKMKALSEADTTITEYVDDVRQDQYTSLQYIIAFSIINIIVCLVVIAVYDNILNVSAPFFMTEAIIIFLSVMIELFHFVSYLNPNAIKEKSSLDKDSIDAEYNENTNQALNNFTPFITDYNILEKLIKDFAYNLIDASIPVNKLQFFDSLDILFHNEIINREIYSIIDEFRRYRNALVHSLDIDKSVNPLIYERLNNVSKLLKDVFDAKTSNNDNVFKEKQFELHNYGKTHGYNEIDRKILNYMANHSHVSLHEISNYTNCSSSYVRRRIANLQNMGVIRKIGDGKQTKWQVNSHIL